MSGRSTSRRRKSFCANSNSSASLARTRVLPYNVFTKINGGFSSRTLIIENFIPVEDKKKLQERAVFDEDEDSWMLRPLAKDR